MNVLKNKIILFGFRWLPAVPLFEICDKMRPYLKAYRLHLSEEKILFPEETNLRRYIALRRQSAEQYATGIPYRNIVIIQKNREGTILYLRTGHVFSFTPGSMAPEIVNVYPVKHLRLWKK